MTTLYRIEINVFLNDGMRANVIQAAREDYKKSGGAWIEEHGRKVKIPVDEFLIDTKTAFLELAESAFRSALPGIEPHTFSCDVVDSATEVRPRAVPVPSCRSRTRR